MRDKKRDELLEIYRLLRNRFGHRNWWPADSSFEVIIGAILTQNVAWNNASKAIDGLKRANMLEPLALNERAAEEIAPLIKPSRFYNMKAMKIKNFMDFYYREYGGDLSVMSAESPAVLRKKLLAVKGLGQETADCILLYACGMPIFVVDAYTKRILQRYGIFKKEPSYEEAQRYFTENLPRDIELYNDFHAQIVQLGNCVCKTRPLCGSCPIAAVNGSKCRFTITTVHRSE
ncbi:MAG TPA: endonuclease III domain-containing protein [Methanocella sp.]|uniref:endonuclease III domain-containing protein n=1 Tax=Methanocella sp. TaxID=2052833 RepID=UPI002BD77649|nr:endonuclease III domain-containing protein [Methanocella sp.]HTY92018.1 endonuclease III domain-containing protein [Methanocella sp.]